VESGYVAHQWRKGIPSPEGYHETEPREEEDSAIGVDGIQGGDGPSLAVDGVDLGRSPQPGHVETHDDESLGSPRHSAGLGAGKSRRTKFYQLSLGSFTVFRASSAGYLTIAGVVSRAAGRSDVTI
jgi:hypothetical protein